MDISEYWKSIKKQSKSISGVKRVGDGLFNKSGIGPSLEKYTKAVKAGKPDKVMKEANAALVKVRVYLKTIHAKEMQNKKEYSPAQLKSMAIIGTACEKINIQLKDVLFDNAKAGSFDGDAGKDAKISGIDPKLKKAAEEHLDLRKRMVPESAKLLKKYRSQAAKVPNYLKIGKKGAAQAVASKRAGNTSDNIRAIDLATRALEEIQGILEPVSNDYDKNVKRDSSNIAQARKDLTGRVLNKLPEPYRTDYMRESGKYFKAMDQNGGAIAKLVNDLRNAVSEAESYLDVAEANSMGAIDPAKLIKKVKAIHVAAEKTKKDLELASSRLKDAGNKAMDVANSSSLDFETKKKAIKTRIEFFNKNYVRAKGLAKQERALKGRLSTIGANVEDRGVLDAIGEVDAVFKEALSWVQEIGKVGPASKRKMDQAVAQIKAEGARAA